MSSLDTVPSGPRPEDPAPTHGSTRPRPKAPPHPRRRGRLHRPLRGDRHETCANPPLGGECRPGAAPSGSFRTNVSVVLESTVGKVRRESHRLQAQRIRPQRECTAGGVRTVREPAPGSIPRRVAGREGLSSPLVGNLVIVIVTGLGGEVDGGLFVVAIRVLRSSHDPSISSRRT